MKNSGTTERQLVSVVIPVYNGERHIKDAIDSVLAQTYSQVELIVVDDGSTDNTKSLIKEYEGVEYRYQKNAGQAAARNSGIKHSRGEFVAFLDADDVWLPDKLEKQVPLFSDPSVGLVYCNMKFFGSSCKFNSRFEMSNGKVYRGSVTPQLLCRNFIPVSTAVARKSVVNEAGLFDERVEYRPVGGEDYELWLRISIQHDVDFVDAILAKYCLRSDQMSKDRGTSYKFLMFLYRDLLKRDSFKSFRSIIVRKSLESVAKFYFFAIFGRVFNKE